MGKGWDSHKLLFIIAGLIAISYSVDVVFADSDVTPSVSLDRSVYPVPFGGFDDFEEVTGSTPDGRSLFPLHATAIVPAKIESDETLSVGDLVLHIRITDPNFDATREDGLELFHELSRDVPDTTVGPLKISVSRDSQTVVLAYAGGSTPNENGVIDVGDDNPENTRQLGTLLELAPDAGIVDLDFVLRYTDGPSYFKCPVTTTFTSLNDDAVSGSEESRFDAISDYGENYCILNGDVLTVEYTYLDESGNIAVVEDTATFELRDGTLTSEKQIYATGHDVILTLTEPDLDLDNDKAETYSLDLIEWDSDSATVTLGELGGEIVAFDPAFPHFRETGDSTGIFQTVIEIPQTLQDGELKKGEEIILEYTDWGPSGVQYVGQEDEDVNWIIYTYVSPLKQTKLGISANEIICNFDMVLALKYDGSPACVKEQTISKLIERNWIE